MSSVSEALVGGFTFSPTLAASFFPPDLFLAGAGVRGLEIEENFVVFTAIAVYLEKKALPWLEGKWKGKNAEELTRSNEFFRDIVAGGFQKLTQVRMVKPLSGEQYSEKVSENCVAFWRRCLDSSSSSFTEEEWSKAIAEFRKIFKYRSFPPGSSIFFTQSPTGSLLVGFSEGGDVPVAADGIIESPQLAEAVLESIIGQNGVSPQAKSNLATRISWLLNGEKGGEN